ncbi:hypothetical protein [Pseudomonas sp. CCC2.2]|uniref:hypothetical protein n=1 Tax=Pseudomonas sp. CCC2.2 TaxID=3048605 RepID=UPI002B23E868|nr:hypothetical protein [Pseudomonas sp. CCC2.2]MEB0147534.1 hypothetical protein [Pseudomonas sp. CCC2.2]
MSTPPTKQADNKKTEQRNRNKIERAKKKNRHNKGRRDNRKTIVQKTGKKNSKTHDNALFYTGSHRRTQARRNLFTTIYAGGITNMIQHKKLKVASIMLPPAND